MSSASMGSSFPMDGVGHGLGDGSAERLLEHSVWMKRLARTLVRDGDRAEELTQETWLRLLEHPPRLDGPVRGWIATVMRNLVRSTRRGEQRRADRERTSSRTDAHDASGLDLLERAVLQRELVQAVLELEEPYRTAILLRYFEERSPSAIAKGEGIPVATVKTRLARGIARLRERLGRTRGPGGCASVLSGLALLEPRPPLPFPTPPSWPSGLSWTLGALAVNLKLVVSVVVLVAAGLSAYWLASDGAGPARSTAITVAAAPASGELAQPEVHALAAAPESTAPERELAPASSPAAARPPLPAAGASKMRGRVIDCEQRPVPGVAIASQARSSRDSDSGEVVAHADAEGRFELERGVGAGELHVREEAWTTVLAAMPNQAGSDVEVLLVVAPRVTLAGVVVDEYGTPVEGARVDFRTPAELRARLSLVLDFSADVYWAVDTDAAGEFRLEDVPAIDDLPVRIHKEGFVTFEEQASPRASREDLVVVLERPTSLTGVLEGRVVDPVGVPVEGAVVSLAIDTTRTDASGFFEFQLAAPESFNRMMREHMPVVADRLVALKRGYLPGDVAMVRDGDERRWPDPIVIVLGDEPLTLSGQVLDDGGEPRAGVRVWLVDPTFFGGVVREGEHFPDLTHVESQLAGLGTGWNWSESDADGRFELEGLAPRDYTLAVMDPETLARKEFPGIAAGRRDVVLRLPGDLEFPKLAGRVVDGRGLPVVGAAIFPMCDAFQTRFQAEVISTYHAAAAATTTDGAGRFELARVPRDLAYLRIEADDTIPLEWGRDVEGGLTSLVNDPGALEITVARRCHFQVELAQPDEADELDVLDARGEVLVISEFHGNGRNDTERHPLRDGRSSTLAVGDSAAQLVLYRDGVEVRRVPVHLAPGEPTLLHP